MVSVFDWPKDLRLQPFTLASIIDESSVRVYHQAYNFTQLDSYMKTS